MVNVIHTVVCDILCSILKASDINLINQLLNEAHLMDKIMDTLTNNPDVGYRGHLRIVANALRACPIPEVAAYLQSNPRWTQFLIRLDYLNEFHIGYREAENRRRDQLRKEAE